MEESSAPMQTDSVEVAEAAPLSEGLGPENETDEPAEDIASPSTKTAAADKGEKSPVPELSSSVDYASWDFEPPLANMRRLLKPILAKGTNISKDSVTALSRAAGIFVLYLSNCATDVAREGKRSTIAGKDVMKALRELDLEEFIPELEQFMREHKKYEQTKKDEKDRMRKMHTDSGKNVRGADGKYVGLASDEKGDEKDDDSDDDENEINDAAATEMSEFTAKHGLEHDDSDDSEVKKMKLEHDDEASD